MWDWLKYLGELPSIAGALVVFTFCLYLILKYLSKNVVEPFKTLVGNHMAHLSEDQKADRDERTAMRGASDEQTKAIMSQAETFRALCEKLNKT